MPTIEETRALLVEKLKELFQLDQPDLDFGFYRIMHLRSKEINEFLEHDLLTQVKDALTEYTPVEKQDIQKRLNEAIKQAESLGVDPETLPKVKELREKLSESIDMKQVECDVYDALYHFFSRYYSDGDFISQRVYKEGVYAIPYEGEEVKLHWANADQYYVKTCEYLRDYCFRTESNRRVHFKLVDATEGEHGNIKASEGKNRVFILAKENFCTEENGELILRFEYRPATMNDWPKDQRSDQKSPPTQDDLITFADAHILAQKNTETWTDELGKLYLKSDGEDADYSILSHHLKRYAARNTFDYFIHKDLGPFLRRELDFFIKNEIMYLDDIEKETAPRVEQYLSQLRAIRRIAKKIITFLAQLEDFQKKLWLKKKFVVETNYCITLDRIPEEFYEEIAANNAQREEWEKLFAIDEITPVSQQGKTTNYRNKDFVYACPLTVTFLKAYSYLVLDTKFFSEDFKQRLLDAIPNFDEQCDGLLIHSENFQALNLLQQRYKEQVKCVYIDPPYNTGGDGFIYKDSYQHSTWLTCVADRVSLSSSFFTQDGSHFTSIGDEEIDNLKKLFEYIWEETSYKSMIIIRRGAKNVQAQFETIDSLNRGYEFVLHNVPHNNTRFEKLLIPSDDEREDNVSGSWNNHWRGTDRPTMRYNIFGIVPERGQWRWGEERSHIAIKNYQRCCNEIGIDEPSQDSIDKWYMKESQKTKDKIDLLRLSKTGKPEHYIPPANEKLANDLWIDIKPNGSRQLERLFPENQFATPKSYDLIERIIRLSCGSEIESTILDYFAGSGTTGHAVINLNREDDGHRKYILVEMGDHFETVLKPRIEKVVYSKDWKDGKPVLDKPSTNTVPPAKVTLNGIQVDQQTLFSDETDELFKTGKITSFSTQAQDPISTKNSDYRPENPYNGVSQCVKYIRLESYEDTLNNLAFAPNGKLQKELKFNEDPDLREEYILKYYLEMESHESPSLLSVDAFFEPTEYRLQIKKAGSDESVYQTVDLLETFNYLIGLKVDRIAKPEHFTAMFKRDQDGKLILDGKLKRDANGLWWFRLVTGETLDGQKVLIIWRNRPGKDVVKEDSFEMSDKNAIYPGMEQDNIVLDAWFEKLGFDSTSNEFDIIYVNGTNNLDNLNTSNSKWKIRLIEDEFQTKMWN